MKMEKLDNKKIEGDDPNIDTFNRLYKFYTPRQPKEILEFDTSDLYRGQFPKFPKRENGKKWKISYLTRGVPHLEILKKIMDSSPNDVSLSFLGEKISTDKPWDIILKDSEVNIVLEDTLLLDIVFCDPSSFLLENLIKSNKLIEWGGLVCILTSSKLSKFNSDAYIKYYNQVFNILRPKRDTLMGFDLNKTEVIRFIKELEKRAKT